MRGPKPSRWDRKRTLSNCDRLSLTVPPVLAVEVPVLLDHQSRALDTVVVCTVVVGVSEEVVAEVLVVAIEVEAEVEDRTIKTVPASTAVVVVGVDTAVTTTVVTAIQLIELRVETAATAVAHKKDPLPSLKVQDLAKVPMLSHPRDRTSQKVL